MPETPAWVPVAALLLIAGLVWLALLPLWMYNRVKGIERALWAVVTQLQQMRKEAPFDDPVQSALHQRDSLSPPGKISNSMFGR